MIRPFNLRDLALVHRLSEQGVLLQAETALTKSPHSLRSALVNMLLGGSYSTYVWKSSENDAAAFVQIQLEEGCPSARIIILGSESGSKRDEDRTAIEEDIWLPLLDQLVVEVGRRGFHNLIAETGEAGPELPVLRRAGFAVYTRQDIWICNGTVTGADPDLLRPHQSIDDWDIQLLYSNIVPRLIQLVESGPPLNHGLNWVLREEDELAAHIHISQGPVAGWMRLLIHPNARTPVEEIVRAALAVKPNPSGHPIYCCVRRYQSWLQGPLERAGFRLWGSQAVMVKHLTQRIESGVPAHSALLEPRAVPGSSPLVQGFSHSAGNGQRNH